MMATLSAPVQSASTATESDSLDIARSLYARILSPQPDDTPKRVQDLVDQMDKNLERANQTRAALNLDKTLPVINRDIKAAVAGAHLNAARSFYAILRQGTHTPVEAGEIVKYIDEHLAAADQTCAVLDPAKSGKGVNRALRQALSRAGVTTNDPLFGAFLAGRSRGR